MCVLTHDAIHAEIERGRLRIEPFELDQIGPASIDLHLGHELRVPTARRNGPIDVTDDADFAEHTEVVCLDQPYVLEPGRTVHGLTQERVSLPPDVCAWIEGRSRIARLGLTVHVTSGFMHPGGSNHQVLELANLSSNALVLHAGARICQIVLERTEGEAVYTGRFADQKAP
jgi:dCTP deaminase